MNIILKSFLITLAVMMLMLLIISAVILPGFYGLIGLTVIVFAMMWVYVYFLLK